MTTTTLKLTLCLLCSAIVIWPIGRASGQALIEKTVKIQPQKISDDLIGTRLLVPAASRTSGNAAPTLLRLPHERKNWLDLQLPKLTHEFVGRDPNDPELQAFFFDGLAKEIILAANLSHADWGYPLYAANPEDILLPDAQMMRHFLGAGMTVWIKQQIGKEDYSEAMLGIQAQMTCAQHMSATPIFVTQMIGHNTIANQALDNVELLIQQPANIENMYWALAVLPRFLGDMSAASEWETYFSRKMIPNLTEPWPEVGSAKWRILLKKYLDVLEKFYGPLYDQTNQEEVEKITARLDQAASRFLREELDWTEDNLLKATVEERIMRWLIAQKRWFDLQTEQMTVVSVPQAVEIHRRIRAASAAVMQECGLKHDPFFQASTVTIGCLRFHRRVHFLQALEAIRDYAARNQGQFPESLDHLKFPAPVDPFTGEAFEYHKDGDAAVLAYPLVEGAPYESRRYRLIR